MEEEPLNQLNGWQPGGGEGEGWLGIRVTRGVTGVADGIGEIFEYLMARDDKDEIKRGGNSRFRRLSSGKGSRLISSIGREKSRLRMLEGEEEGGFLSSALFLIVFLGMVLFEDLRMSVFEEVLFFAHETNLPIQVSLLCFLRLVKNLNPWIVYDTRLRMIETKLQVILIISM